MPPAREFMDGAHDTWGTLQIRIRFVRQQAYHRQTLETIKKATATFQKQV